MNCPRCESVMLVYELQGVEIDYCEECGGIWLDAGELERLLQDRAEDVMSNFEVIKHSKEPKLRCPACGKKMEKVICGNTQLDKCKKGHGIWFDEGELSEVIAYGDINSEVLNLLDEIFADKIKEGD